MTAVYGDPVEDDWPLLALRHDTDLLRLFDEEQVYRIDHFLGKEATQNLHLVRFSNRLFNDTWNREHLAQVQIDVPAYARALGALARNSDLRSRMGVAGGGALYSALAGPVEPMHDPMTFEQTTK